MYNSTKFTSEKGNKKNPSVSLISKHEISRKFHNFAAGSLADKKWGGKKMFRTGAFDDNSMISPVLIGWAAWLPSMYAKLSSVDHAISMVWSDFTHPCITPELAPLGSMGSLTMYWRSFDNIGITKPPAESIAAVDPAAVETLKPLDRQFTNEPHDSPLPLSLRKRNKGLYRLQNLKLRDWTPESAPYLNENRDNVAGHECAIKRSFRACECNKCELTRMDILDIWDGLARLLRISSNTYKENLIAKFISYTTEL